MITAAEKDRRLRLYQAHTDAENDHDLDAIMATFADRAENSFNTTMFFGYQEIANAHAGFGFSEFPGALEGLRSQTEAIYYTEDAIVAVVRLFGRFVRPLGVFPPTNRDVELIGMSAYRFDAEDKLAHERVVMNFGPLVRAS